MPPRTQSQKYIDPKQNLFTFHEEKELEEAQKRIRQNILLQYCHKNIHESNRIISCLKNHFIFYNLSEDQLENIKQKMYRCRVMQNDYVFQEGDLGTSFFIVEIGELQVLKDNKFQKSLKVQDGFGEIALLYNTQRTVAVRARENSTLWLIDRITFRKAVDEVILKEFTQNRKNIESIKFFMNLTNDQKDTLTSALITQKFYKGQTIIQQGDPGSSLYYIKEGTASVTKGDKFIRKVSRGDSFGEQSLFYNTMRQLTIKADQQVICLVLGRDTLNRMLGDKIYDVTFKNFLSCAFDKNDILSKLSKEITDQIISSMKISSYKANESIFRKGIAGFQKLVVVIEGSIKRGKNSATVATKGQCFGQQYLLNENRHKVLDDEIIMHAYGIIAEISDIALFEAISSDSIEEVIKKAEARQKSQFSRYENMLKLEFRNKNVENMTVMERYAQGQFGPIMLIKDSRHRYTLKLIDKLKLQKYEVEEFIAEQSFIIEEMAFPFVIKNALKIQNNKYLCQINQYINGQDFNYVLKNIGLLSTQDSQFYSAIIILILEYFDNVRIVSRDIKPENFVVDQDGYLKLIGLYTCKRIHNQENKKIGKTLTIIGTPHYMAPDIVLGKGYNNLADLWSLGICIYEFLCGFLPFGDSAQGAYEIYQQIMQAELKFPDFIRDKKARKLITQLLNHNPQQRHGGSFKALKSHLWFQGFDWEGLMIKKFKGFKIPYVPQRKHEFHRGDEFTGLNVVQLMRKFNEGQNYNLSHDWSSFGRYIN